MSGNIADDLWAHYPCRDRDNPFTVGDASGHGRDLKAKGASLAAKSLIDGWRARRFTQETDSVVTNYFSAKFSDADFQALVGVNNGHNGDTSAACWYRRSPVGPITAGSVYEDGLVIVCGGAVDFDVLQNGQNAGLGAWRLNSTDGTTNFTDNKIDVNYYSADETTFDYYSTYQGPWDDGAWHHVCYSARVTVPGTSQVIDLYVDGVLVESSGTVPCSFAQAGLYPDAGLGCFVGLGCTLFGDDVINGAYDQTGGQLADVRLYSRALNAADVALLQNTNPRGTPGTSIEVNPATSSTTATTH